MSKIPTMTIPEALNYLRSYRSEVDNPMVVKACHTVEDALMQNFSKLWHPCSYEDGELLHDGSWVPGKWYEWLDKYNNREVARMKAASTDRFFPSTRVISENNVIAFREIDGERYE